MAASEIDGYLRALDEPKRSTLEEMRRRILEIVPKSEQCLSYSVPAFKIQGKTFAGLAAFKNHLSYLPHSGSVLAQLQDELGRYKQTKSALHFAVDEPLPGHLVRSLILVRLRECGLL
ncbi:MAG: hypothetical protein QOJ03_46 [Frankiaceae bacterium]|jgi:uncharacterized protein YdhG (YjbR/CyaY superfamily)|nr:hypothetical protein [Frankiaceae bacterium]